MAMAEASPKTKVREILVTNSDFMRGAGGVDGSGVLAQFTFMARQRQHQCDGERGGAEGFQAAAHHAGNPTVAVTVQ